MALLFTVKHPEKQKWLRMEGLLQPQRYRSVVLSAAMDDHTRAECGAQLYLQGQKNFVLTLFVAQTSYEQEPRCLSSAGNKDKAGLSC